jgi:hypothetical protein
MVGLRKEVGPKIRELLDFREARGRGPMRPWASDLHSLWMQRRCAAMGEARVSV